MAEVLMFEQEAQLYQMKEPLETINHQAWRLMVSPSLSRGEIEQIANQLQNAARQIGSSILAITGENEIPTSSTDLELPAFSEERFLASESV